MNFPSPFGGVCLASVSLVTLALVALPATPATAATTTVTTAPVCGDMGYIKTPVVDTAIALPKFNPALGELQSATITGNITMRAQVRGENLHMTLPVTVNFTNEFNGTVSVPGIPAAAVTGDIPGTATTPVFDGVLDLSGSSAFSTGPVDKTVALETQVVTGTSLDSYKGLDSFDSLINATASSTSDSQTNLAIEYVTGALATVCVSYSYLVTTSTPEPEPEPEKTLPAAGAESAAPGLATSAALLVLGASLLALVRRRSRANG